MDWLRKIFGRKRDSFNKDGLIIKPAFTVGGVEYFEIENVYTLPVHRGIGAVHIYRELKMNCDDEFLKAHVAASENIYNGKRIGIDEISKLKQLNNQLKERLYNIIDTDLVYKLASVVFFDKTESPFEYDWEYARKKIIHWKKHASVSAFFLQEPLIRLLPFLKQQNVNFQTYSEAIAVFNQVQWDSLWNLLSEKQRELFKNSYGFYVKEMQPESMN